MIIRGEYGAALAVDVVTQAASRRLVLGLSIDPGDNRGALAISLDENHAAAFVLQLQAAIAELQARTVQS